MEDYKLLEEKGQTNIFYFLDIDDVEEEEEKEEFFIGQKVLITLKRMDEESKNYFKYYYPGVISKEGYITEIRGNQVEVFVEGDHIQMRKDELIWRGLSMQLW